MPYVPLHQAQLGRGIPVPGRTRGSVDCGPRSWQVIADAQSRGRVRPGVRRLRNRGGCTGPVPTNIDDAHRALNGLPVPGRTPLRFYRKRKMADIRRAVANGRPVLLAISYHEWNKRNKRETGDPNFIGGHAVAVIGQRDRGHGIEWLLYDPLEDGRRPEVERGPQWRKRSDIVASAVALADGDRSGVWGGVMGGAHAR